MYRSSFDAIKLFLNSKFSAITNIYLNSTPAGFTRPSFLVQLMKGSSEDLNRNQYQTKITWQIIYYPPQDQAGIIDLNDQLNITEQLQQNLMEIMTLTAPDGTRYQTLSLDMEARDKDLCCSITLAALSNRAEVQYDLMQTINTEYKEG